MADMIRKIGSGVLRTFGLQRRKWVEHEIQKRLEIQKKKLARSQSNLGPHQEFPPKTKTVPAIPKQASAIGAEPVPLTRTGPVGLEGMVDCGKHTNFLLLAAIDSFDLRKVDELAPMVPGILQVMRDLGITWQDCPGLYRSRNFLLDPARKPVVVIGQDETSTVQDGWNNDRLIDLAQHENPGAPIIFCLGEAGTLSDHMRYESDTRIDYAGYFLGDALSVAERAYTIAAAGGMDALIHGVPLTVVGAPLYAGWGFTDDRAETLGRKKQFGFAQFFIILNFFTSDGGPDVSDPDAQALVLLKSIFDLYARNISNRDQETSNRLMAALPDLCVSNAWPALFERKVHSEMTVEHRIAALDQMIAADILGQIRNPEASRILGTILAGKYHATAARDRVMTYLEARLETEAFLRLVRDLSRLSGIPIAVLLPSASEQLLTQLAPRIGDDVVGAAAVQLQIDGRRGAEILREWATAAFEKRNLRSAGRLLDCCFLTGRYNAEMFDLMAEILWQRFDFAAAAQLLEWSGRAYPKWKAGRFHWRAAYAAAVAGDNGQVLGHIAHASIRNEANLQRLETLEDQITARYPGTPVAEALEAYVLDGGPNRNPVKLARYLTRQHRPAEAEKALRKANSALRETQGYLTEMTYALALQGRHDQARKLIEARLKQIGPDEAVLTQGMRISYFSGDARWGMQLLKLARENGFAVTPTLERQVMLGAGDFHGAMASERTHVVGDIIKPHLCGRHVSTLKALTEGSGKTLLVALINGPADDVRWAALFPKLAAACRGHRLRITCDQRLLTLLNRSFPEIEFIPSVRIRNVLPEAQDHDILPAAEVQKVFDGTGWQAAMASDRVALITDLAADLILDPHGFDARPYLLPDPARVQEWTDLLRDLPRPLVGIAWSSMRTTVLRQYDYLGVKEVKDLIAGSDVQFVNLQYFDCSDDLAEIEAAHPGRMLHFPDLDQMDDIEGVVALMTCLDVVITPNSTPLILASASGCPTWYVDPAIANKYWGRFTRKQTDYWFGTSVYVNGDAPGDKSGLVTRLCAGLAELTDSAYEDRLARIEALLATEAPTAEARFFAYRREILDAEEEMLSRRLYRDVRYWELRARVFEKLGIHRDAAECWMQACSQSPNPASEHLLAHWHAQVRIGRPDLAEKFGPIDMSRLVSEDLALKADLESDKISNDLVNSGLALLADGQRRRAAQKFRQAVRASWRQVEYRELLENVVDRFAGMEGFSRPPGPQRDVAMSVWALPKLDSYIRHAALRQKLTVALQAFGGTTTAKPRSVFCSGYMFSGSGAVVDFLRQSSQTIIPRQDDGDQKPFDTELNIFRRFYGVQHLLDAPVTDLSFEHLGEFLMGSVLGLVAHPSDSYRLNLSRTRSLRGAFEHSHNMETLVNLCDQLLDDVENGPGSDSERILAAACRLCNALVGEMAMPERNVVIWNNCIQAYNARTMAIFERAVMFAVARDPRDQYVAQCYEWGDRHGRNTVRNFIRRTRHHQELRAQLELIPGLRDRIMDVRFEDVLTNASTREQILDFAGLSRDGFQEGQYFKPEESLRNVGIYRSFPDQDTIRDIAREFPHLLWKG